MTILFAAAGTPLACFAEGAILAASVYLVSRGVRRRSLFDVRRGGLAQTTAPAKLGAVIYFPPPKTTLLSRRESKLVIPHS